jgi:hypothetical protein
LIFANNHFLAILDDFEFLFERSSELLGAFHFLISHAIFEVSNFFFEGQFIADEYIIQFFVLHGQVLNGRAVTLRVLYSDLHFYSAFLSFR